MKQITQYFWKVSVGSIDTFLRGGDGVGGGDLKLKVEAGTLMTPFVTSNLSKKVSLI